MVGRISYAQEFLGISTFFVFRVRVSHAMLLLLPFAFCYICISHFIIYFFLLSLSGISTLFSFFVCWVAGWFLSAQLFVKTFIATLKTEQQKQDHTIRIRKSEINTINI